MILFQAFVSDFLIHFVFLWVLFIYVLQQCPCYFFHIVVAALFITYINHTYFPQFSLRHIAKRFEDIFS